MEIETETHIGALDWAPKVQMRSRRRENMNKGVRTVRGVFTHWFKGTDLMRAQQGQLAWDWTSMWSNRILWLWLTWGLTEKPLTMALGLVSSSCTGFLGSLSVCRPTFLDLEGGVRNLNSPQGRKPWLFLGLQWEEKGVEWEGIGRRGGSGNFYK